VLASLFLPVLAMVDLSAGYIAPKKGDDVSQDA